MNFMDALLSINNILIPTRLIVSEQAAKQPASDKIYLSSAALLFLLNLSLVVPVSLLVLLQKPVKISLIPAITMAAYTTY